MYDVTHIDDTAKPLTDRRRARVLGETGGNVLYYRYDVPWHMTATGSPSHPKRFLLSADVFWGRYVR